MKVKKVHCLFEQSGTWKNEFKKLGIVAEDYDILNNYGETDHVCDLFSDIRKSSEGGVSLFDSIMAEDLVVAFFPCTRFEAKVPLLFRGEAFQQTKWDENRKLRYSIQLHEELHDLYVLLCKMFHVLNEKGIRAIVENPYTQPHYLTTYFPVKPSVVDRDRTQMGDYYKKPTQYWFLNCKPEDNLVFEPLDYVQRLTIANVKTSDDSIVTGSIQERRSLMHPQYANRFIRRYILDANIEGR